MDDEALLRSFCHTLLDLFGGSEWEEVEPYAARAWRELAHNRADDWPRVRVLLRACWVGSAA